MSSLSTPLAVDATWERPAIVTGNGETHLVVRVSAARSAFASRVPVDLALMIDRSGSMAGDKLDLATAGVRTALGLLRPEDRAGLVAYDHEVDALAPLAHLDRFARRTLDGRLDRLEARGSTDLFGGWTAGCEALASGRDRAAGPRLKRTLLLTDGLANVGTTDPVEITHHAAQLRVRRISTSTLGVGTDFDEDLLTRMAEAGGGNFAWVEHPRELPAFFARELGELLTVAALDAKLRLTLPSGLRATLLNPYPVDRVGKALTVQLGDLPAGLTVHLVFSVTGRFAGPVPIAPPALELDWAEVEGDRRSTVPVGVDAIRVVTPVEFERAPRDDGASEQVARTRAERAKREAITHYRAGRHGDARRLLVSAMAVTLAAPMAASDTTLRELDELMAVDPSGPAFESVRRRTLNEAHRRSRGREA